MRIYIETDDWEPHCSNIPKDHKDIALQAIELSRLPAIWVRIPAASGH